MGYTPPQLELRKVAGGWSAYSPNATTTDDLTIFPNTTDTTASLQLRGAGGFVLDTTAGEVIIVKYGGTSCGFIAANATELGISTYDNRDIKITPGGTGKLKYGTYVAGAKADSIGYIEILDSGGTSRRLMVQSA